MAASGSGHAIGTQRQLVAVAAFAMRIRHAALARVIEAAPA